MTKECNFYPDKVFIIYFGGLIMNTIELIMGIILLVLAVILTVIVLLQSGKDKRLSGTIAGAAETFFGKSKAAGSDKKLTIVTAVLSAVFGLFVLVMYCVVGNLV